MKTQPITGKPTKQNNIDAGKLLRSYRALKDHKIASLYAFVGCNDGVKKLLKPTPTINEIMNEYCEIINVTPEQLLQKTRDRDEVIIPRQTLMYFIAQRKINKKIATGTINATYKSIGAKLGGFGHCTVIHSEKSIQNLIDVYPSFAHQYRVTEKQLCDKFNIK